MVTLPQVHIEAVLHRWISRPGKQCREAIRLVSSYLLIPSQESERAFLWQSESQEPLPVVKARLWNEFSTHLATCDVCGLGAVERRDQRMEGE